MDSRINNYLQEVLGYIAADESVKNRISKDLQLHISAACEHDSLDNVLSNMGSPEEVAKEFMENIYEDKDEVIEKLIHERSSINSKISGYFEYTSKIKLFGLPLVHIKHRKMRGINSSPGVAKGIIALGDVAIGIVAVGGAAFGLISLGALAAGILSFGAVALGAILACGGVAVGTLAIGGVAIGLGAVGGLAIGKIAIGGYAKGTVAIGGTAIGEYVKSGTSTDFSSIGHISKEEIRALIKAAYPKLSDWIVNIFTLFSR